MESLGGAVLRGGSDPEVLRHRYLYVFAFFVLFSVENFDKSLLTKIEVGGFLRNVV